MIKRRAQRNEPGQITILGAEAIERPGTETWTIEDGVAGVDRQQGRTVRHLVASIHRADYADVIDAGGNVRKQFADFNPALSMLLELPRRGEQIAGSGEFKFGFGDRQRFAVHLGELWLRVERIDMRNPAVHEQEYDPLRTRSELRRRRASFLAQQSRQRHAAKATGEVAQGIAT